MLTLRGATVLVTAAMLWAVGRLLGVAELYVLAATAVALVLASTVAVHASSTSISVRRTVSDRRLPHGGVAEVALELRNDGRLPTALLLIDDACHQALVGDRARFVVAGLPQGRTVSVGYRIHGTIRGRYALGPATLRIRDPFGLAERVRRTADAHEVLVHPRVEPLGTALSGGSDRGGGGRAGRRLPHSGDEFSTLREYVVGDDLRQVHWPSTAHRHKIMIRQHEHLWQPRATILLAVGDAGRAAQRGDTALETAVSAAASLIVHLAAQGYELHLVLPGGERLSSAHSTQVLLDRLVDVQGYGRPSLLPLLDRLRGSAQGLLAVVTDSRPGEAEAAALLRTGRGPGPRLCLLVDRGGGGPDSTSARLLGQLVHGGWSATALRPAARVAHQLDPAARSAQRGSTPSTHRAGATA